MAPVGFKHTELKANWKKPKINVFEWPQNSNFGAQNRLQNFGARICFTFDVNCEVPWNKFRQPFLGIHLFVSILSMFLRPLHVTPINNRHILTVLPHSISHESANSNKTGWFCQEKNQVLVVAAHKNNLQAIKNQNGITKLVIFRESYCVFLKNGIF